MQQSVSIVGQHAPVEVNESLQRAAQRASSMREALSKRGNKLKEAHAQIEELTQIDELTVLLNRHYILKFLNEEMARRQGSKVPCSVAIIDLDFFERINDQFGHSAGDEALRTFAITLFANIRTLDKLGRCGGAEFLLILPDTTKDQAVQAVDRLRSIVSEVEWATIADNMKLTLSAGVCSIRQHDAADDILARAKIALHQAKDAGRNQVVAV
jgi:diguanylate cyclase (GGDEF)-like protein